jgi:hypothetical protein
MALLSGAQSSRSSSRAQSLPRQKSHREPGHFSRERYEAANLTYSELKRSHELANEHSPH